MTHFRVGPSISIIGPPVIGQLTEHSSSGIENATTSSPRLDPAP